jgi:glycyl-tRNA synthetase
MHSKATGTKLVVREPLTTPIITEVWQANFDRKKFGPKFRGDAKPLEEIILKMSQLELESCKKVLDGEGKVEVNVNGKELVIGTDLMQIDLVTQKETGMNPIDLTDKVYEYTPNVIEPSFGIGRILYSLIEHSYWPRPEDKQRGVLSFPALIAPTKCLLVPLSNHKLLDPLVAPLGTVIFNVLT